MHRPGSQRTPTFFWQGMLIILPVIVLAIAGLASLRQDRLIAEGEARAKAGEVADALVPQLQHEFDPFASLQVSGVTWLPDAAQNFMQNPTSTVADDPILTHATSTNGHRFQVVLTGQKDDLIYPPPLRTVPMPHPLDLSVLTPAQSNLWSAALDAEFAHRNPSEAVAAFNRFLDTSPPEVFAARACYDSGLILRELGQPETSLNRLGRAMREYGELLSEGGIPYRQLALLQCANDATYPKVTNTLWNLMCKEVVLHPTILSERLLNLALENAHGDHRKEVEDWIRVWNSHQASREVYQEYYRFRHEENQSPPLPAGGLTGEFYWLAGNQWLAIGGVVGLTSNTSDGLILAQSASDLRQKAQEIIDGKRGPNRLRMPGIFGVDLEIQGCKLLNCSNRGVRLASREILDPLNYPAPLRIKFDIYLADAATFYAHQRQRAIIFGSLIAVAALAALVGFFAARRAFHRQLHLSEMKSNFVSSVSHELRAPIASVRLMAEGLERGKVQDAQKQNEYFRFIVQECRRLSSLIENVLDFSRIEQGRKQYEFEPTDVVVLAQQTVKLMETYAAERQIKLTLDVTGNPFPFEMDGKAMQQALINLLDNAIKHSPRGSAVTVGLDFEEVGTTRCAVPVAACPAIAASERRRKRSVSPDSESGGRGHRSAMSLPPERPILHLWVEDHGQGIPPEEHEKIFERFYRLGSELRRETQGVGIGLSIVKHIVEAHGGQIIVRSTPGQGSRFTIELPAEKGEP